MNDSTDIAALEQLIDLYCTAWDEPDAAQREAMLKSVWAEGATYTDPNVHTSGISELSAHIGRVISSRPGAKVIRTSLVDSHHGLARFAFKVVRADGPILREGIDFADISDEEKLPRIVGFFGLLASKDQASAQPPFTAGAQLS